jgi:hypothetical protein
VPSQEKTRLPQLYVNHDQPSKKVQSLLTERGIEYQRLNGECPFREVPTLVAPSGRVFQGSAAIRLYFLGENDVNET